MNESFELGEVDRFTTGTVGEPGRRVFYLQATSGSTVVSVKCEKQQVSGLAEFLAGVLADLPPISDPPPAPELVEPVMAAWTAGTMAIGYDESADRIELRVEERVEAEDDSADVEAGEAEETGARLHLSLTRAQVAAYIARAGEVVEAGRPPCTLCGHPRGPDHSCPRTNGHRPPA